MIVVLVLDVNTLSSTPLPLNIDSIQVNRLRGDGIVSIDVPGQLHNDNRPADIVRLEVLDCDPADVLAKLDAE